MINIIDTHTHLDIDDFKTDFNEVIERANKAGVSKMFIPSINLNSIDRILELSLEYKNVIFPMIGLHPEDVNQEYMDVIKKMKEYTKDKHPFIAIGEIGLDFYWTRDNEKEQIDAFEKQVEWAIEKQLPLMIHCRKAQNEMIHILKPYKKELKGGVFHCFTGNEKEAEAFLQFDNFYLGIGGVSTFKKSNLPEVLSTYVSLNRLVLETDSPYMAPVPNRGKRNESAFVVNVAQKLAECYGVSYDDVAMQTNTNVEHLFGVKA